MYQSIVLGDDLGFREADCECNDNLSTPNASLRSGRQSEIHSYQRLPGTSVVCVSMPLGSYGVGNSGGRAPPLMKRAECESCQSYRAVTYFRLNDAKGSNRSYASPQRLRSRPPVAVVDDIGVGQDRSMIIDLY